MWGKTIFGIAMAAAAVGSAAPIAQADAAVCRVVDVAGTREASVCFDLQPNQQGTTVAPELRFSVCQADGCFVSRPAVIGRTGFESGEMPTLEIDTLSSSIRWEGGRLGSVFIGGFEAEVVVPGFCVGDPSFCDTGLAGL